ncbi:hypothetical protein [Nocardia sp. NRRL WC-3656]|nr:hypothetical protein [Nocardia sp. NRRL WC-3656]
MFVPDNDHDSKDDVMESRFTLTDSALGAKFAKRFGNTSMVILTFLSW